MIKKLKTIKQILSENPHKELTTGSIDFMDKRGFWEASVSTEMIKYFGTEINVHHVKSPESVYDYYINDNGIPLWWFLKKWFETDEVELLEDKLFEI
jgi:hypothetical protein